MQPTGQRHELDMLSLMLLIRRLEEVRQPTVASAEGWWLLPALHWSGSGGDLCRHCGVSR